MGLDIEYIEGQTPLEEDEKDGLLIPTVATRQELDEFEQQNIEQALLWSMKRSLKEESIFSEEFIRTVHKKMYGDVWAWAGKFRKTNKNIGVDKWQIAVELRALLDDAKFWVANKSYPPEEIAIRFKHRLVAIHCFPNGNGRHSRLVADIVVDKLFRLPVFTWGGAGLTQHSDTRANYLAAVRAGDKGDIAPLLTFARS
jgi:Fic-DOC domain mobile mystery protein B